MNDEPEELGRTLPHNLEAEKAVLGAVLLLPDACDLATEIVGPHDFFRDAHRRIFEAVLVLAERRAVIDVVTVKDQLTKKGELEEIGGPSYIAALLDGVPRSANVQHYARIVREKSTLRQIIFAANKGLVDAYDAENPSADVLAELDTHLLAIEIGRREGGFVPMDAVMKDAVNQVEKNAAAGQRIIGIPTGLARLDDYTRGFQRGDMVIIGARPSIGKSALALNVAEYAAQNGFTVGLFSLEMGRVSVGIRMLSSAGMVNGHRLMVGDLDESEWPNVSRAVVQLTDARLHIDDTPSISIQEMRARARRLKREHGLDLLIVDYLQLARAVGKFSSREQEVSAVSHGLKAIARTLDCAVLALSQLSRGVESRSDGKPRISDLRESGSLEQDADVILLLWRNEENPEEAEVNVAKQRNGPTGIVKLTYQKRFTRFTSAEGSLI